MRWLHWRGGCVSDVVALERWLHWRGGCIREVAALERLRDRGDYTLTALESRKVVALERWLVREEMAATESDGKLCTPS